MAQQTASEYETGDKITVFYTNSDGEHIEMHETVRSVNDGIIFTQSRRYYQPETENDSGFVHSRIKNYVGTNVHVYDAA